MPNQPKRAFHVASEPDIKAGEVSDVYFARTVQILNARGIRKRVKAEVRLKSFPQSDWNFGVLAGIEEAAARRAIGKGAARDQIAAAASIVFGFDLLEQYPGQSASLMGEFLGD